MVLRGVKEASVLPSAAVIGWGNTDMRTNKASFPDELREVVVPAVSDARCMFPTVNGTRIQVGIVSWGIGCAKNHFPGVYAEVNSPTIRSFITAISGVRPSGSTGPALSGPARSR